MLKISPTSRAEYLEKLPFLDKIAKPTATLSDENTEITVSEDMGASRGENASHTKEKIAQMLDTEIRSFEKQLDALYKNDALNVDADIRVMQTLLEREGLLEEDELHRLIRQAENAQRNN